jgi:RNA polymerase sigma factor (sigma-70 family)
MGASMTKRLNNQLVGSLNEEDCRLLLNHLRSKVGDIHEAEDIVQESLLRVHQAQPAAHNYQARAYLFKIAANIVIDRIRERKQRKLREERWTDTQVRKQNGVAVCSQPSPETWVDRNKKIEQIMAVLNELPEKCQRVFIMHKFKELSYDEVARESGLSRSMVSKYIKKALTHLEERLS